VREKEKGVEACGVADKVRGGRRHPPSLTQLSKSSTLTKPSMEC